MLGRTDFLLLPFKYSQYTNSYRGPVNYSSSDYYAATMGLATASNDYALIIGGREFTGNGSAANNTNWMSSMAPPVSEMMMRVDSITGSVIRSHVTAIYGNWPSNLPTFGMGGTNVSKIVDLTTGILHPAEMAFIAGGKYQAINSTVETFTKSAALIRPGNGAFTPAYDDGDGWIPASAYLDPFYGLPNLVSNRFSPMAAEYMLTPSSDSKTWRNMLLVVGGNSSSFEVLQSPLVYRSSTGQVGLVSESGTSAWTQVPMQNAHASGGVAIAPDQSRMLVFGGYTPSEGMEVFYLQRGPTQFQPSASYIGTVPPVRHGFASGQDKTGRFWVVGGYAVYGYVPSWTDAWAFDFTTNEWVSLPALPKAIAGAQLVFSSVPGSDEVFLIGGHDNTNQPVNGYVMKYLDASPTWAAMSGVMWSDRISGHKAVSIGAATAKTLGGVNLSASATIAIVGGERFRIDQPTVKIPNAMANLDLVRPSSSITFCNAVGLLDPNSNGTYIAGVATAQGGKDWVTITGSNTFYPIASLVVSGWSGSTSFDVINAVSGVFSPTGTLAIAHDEGISGVTVPPGVITLQVARGQIKNNSTVSVKFGTGSNSYVVSSNKIDKIPSQLNSMSTGAIATVPYPLAPSSSVTGSGYWMGYLSGVFFSNPTVYGNGIYFTASYASGNDFNHFFVLPHPTSSIDGIYLQPNVTHSLYIKEQYGNTANYLHAYTKWDGTAMKWLSGPATASENPNSTKLLWFKFDEATTTGNIYETVAATLLGNTSTWASSSEGWLFPQHRTDLISGSRLLRGGSYKDARQSTSHLMSSFTSSLRDWLGSGSYSVEFWYYSPVGIASPTTKERGWFASAGDYQFGENAPPVYWTALSNVNGATDNSFANAAMAGFEAVPRTWIPPMGGEPGYWEDAYDIIYGAGFSSSLPSQIMSSMFSGSDISSIRFNIALKNNGDGIHAYATVYSPSLHVFFGSFGEMGTWSTPTTIAIDVATPGLSYADVLASGCFVIVGFKNYALGSRTIWVDSVDVSATYNLPSSAGRFGGFASGTSNPFALSATPADNVFNGTLITVGSVNPGPRPGCASSRRTTGSSGWNNSTSFTGTCAYYDSGSVTEIWDSNVLLQVGFTANERLFVNWDVGPHKLVSGVSSGSAVVGAEFSTVLPSVDNTWHHVAINVNSAAPETWGTGSLPKRGTISLTLDGVYQTAITAGGTIGPRNTLPQGANPSLSSLFAGTSLVGTPPDYGFVGQTANKPGSQGRVTLGPIKSVIIDDLVISSGTRSSAEILRTYKRGKGQLY